ncbi:hypothetical protein QBC40DRAFT_262650 [Triangularia verruculosa]|uniref:Uncharacterized protein n=1 Tax=Triangularia verruculosa TaxID=2587418 RepID=A0AAN7AZV1_9PEZI|nr:hypothetical protein QBC40DRAFT_262650 [Triangularia verruculosa]
MARIKTRDGRILYVTSMQISGDHATSADKTRQAQQKRLAALTTARRYLTHYTALLQKKDKKLLGKNVDFEKIRRKEALHLGDMWDEGKLTMKNYKRTLKELGKVMAGLKNDGGKASRREENRRFWDEILEGKKDVGDEIDRLKGILGDASDEKNGEGEEENTAPTTVDESQQPEPPKFCTPECLMGLQQGEKLDLNCPNVASHRKGERDYHQICRTKILELVKEQLWREMDGHVSLQWYLDEKKNMARQNPARSRKGMFTLQQYGYTFLVKGYTYWWKQRACHELEMYNRVDDKPERVVPLCFGLYELPTPYTLRIGLNVKNWQLGDSIGYILLLSYGTVATPATYYPSTVGFDEMLANKQLQTALMGQYGICFQKTDIDVPAWWWNGRVVSMDLDDCNIIRWPTLRRRLSREGHSKHERLEYFWKRRAAFKLRQALAKNSKEAGRSRWRVLEES